MHFFFSISAQY